MGESVTVGESVAPSGAAPQRTQVLAEMPWEAPAAKEADLATADSAVEAEPIVATDTEEPVVEAKPVEADPESDKRLSQLAKAEKRQRELIAKERAEAKAAFEADVARHRAEIAPHLEAVKQYQAAKALAKNDPVALMRSLGLTEADFEYAGQQLYNNSAAAATDPKRAASAAQARKERESTDRLEQLQRRLDEFENERKHATEAQQLEQHKGQYLSNAIANLPADAVLLKKLHANSPEKAKAAMWQTAERLFADTGEMPDADDIAGAYEKQRRAELAELGIDVAAFLNAKPAAVPAPAPVARPAKTLDPSTGATTPPPKAADKKTQAERRAELLKAMPWDDGD